MVTIAPFYQKRDKRSYVLTDARMQQYVTDRNIVSLLHDDDKEYHHHNHVVGVRLRL
jgi:hypothetical protein